MFFFPVISVEANIKCLECSDMPHPQDCTFVTECTKYEDCYVEQFVTSGGILLYNSGCLAKDVSYKCKISKRFATSGGILLYISGCLAKDVNYNV